MQKYIRFPGFKYKALTLSYDDGVRQDKRLISIMQKHGLKGTFNVNGGLFGTWRKMEKDEAVELYLASKMEVATHGYQHLSLADVDVSLAVNDILSDRKTLENAFGRIIKGLAYANGSYNAEILPLLKAIGIDWARIAGESEKFDLPTNWLEWQGTCHHDNPRLMELAKTFVEYEPRENPWWGQTLQLFYLWGHSYEFDDHKNWDVIERFAEYMGGRKDIWYATNGEIFEYLQAAERLQFSADGSFVKNPTEIDVYMEYVDYIGKPCVVPAGKTVRTKNGEIL